MGKILRHLFVGVTTTILVIIELIIVLPVYGIAGFIEHLGNIKYVYTDPNTRPNQWADKIFGGDKGEKN